MREVSRAGGRRRPAREPQAELRQVLHDPHREVVEPLRHRSLQERLTYVEGELVRRGLDGAPTLDERDELRPAPAWNRRAVLPRSLLDLVDDRDGQLYAYEQPETPK